MDKERQGGLSHTEKHFSILNEYLQTVPELIPGLNLIKSNPGYANSLYEDYVELVGYMSNFNEEDKQIVRDAKSRVLQGSGDFGTASQLSADELLDQLVTPTLVAELAEESSNILNPSYEPSVQELTKRMLGGHRLKAEGKSPSDDDEESRTVIWGHTMISDQKALVNFIICHHLERFIAIGLSDQGYETAKSKDFLLNSLIDAILIDQLHAKRFNTIYSLWSLPKSKGGLGWINQDRQKSYGL